MSYNHQKIADSQFCLEFLKNEFNIFPPECYSPSDLAIGKSMQKMMEEDFYWFLVSERFIYGRMKGFKKWIQIPCIIFCVIFDF